MKKQNAMFCLVADDFTPRNMNDRKLHEEFCVLDLIQSDLRAEPQRRSDFRGCAAQEDKGSGLQKIIRG